MVGKAEAREETEKTFFVEILFHSYVKIEWHNYIEGETLVMCYNLSVYFCEFY